MRKPPSYRRHATGQGYAKHKGSYHYFGKYEDPESERRYREWLGKILLTNPLSDNRVFNIRDTVSLYKDWARGEYVRDGKPTSQNKRIEIATRPLLQLFGDLPLDRFGLAQFEATQKAMIQLGWSRDYINACCAILKRIWRWAGLREMVSMEVVMRIKECPGLKRGRTAAPEAKKILPATTEQIEKTLTELGSIPAAMVQVQLLCGMRPVEVCIMRPCDIDQSTTPWIYRPEHHKTEHAGKDRVILIGPQARAILKPFIAKRQLRGQLDAYLFSPQEAFEEAIEKSGRENGRKCIRPNKHYSTHGYTQAIKRAAGRAGVSIWTPLQLRHTRLTEIRKLFGIESASAIAGHGNLSTTEIYAEKDMEKAARVAEQTG